MTNEERARNVLAAFEGRSQADSVNYLAKAFEIARTEAYYDGQRELRKSLSKWFGKRVGNWSGGEVAWAITDEWEMAP